MLLDHALAQKPLKKRLFMAMGMASALRGAAALVFCTAGERDHSILPRGSDPARGLRLREKQKTRRIYGLLEKQFRGYYTKASTMKGRTGVEMLHLIERRLDNVVLRMGFVSTRAQGRQLVRHNHILVNGQRVNIPSYRVRDGDKVEVREKSRKIGFVQAAIEAAQTRPIASWVDVEKDKLTGIFKTVPPREELQDPMVREQYVVEYYSR
jgi:small subunit ribosomal protein S4